MLTTRGKTLGVKYKIPGGKLSFALSSALELETWKENTLVKPWLAYVLTTPNSALGATRRLFAVAYQPYRSEALSPLRSVL